MSKDKLSMSLDSIIESSSHQSRGLEQAREDMYYADYRSRERAYEKRRRNDTKDSLQVARRIYVGNLSWKVSWQDLKDFFNECGTVVFADVLRFEDGKSKGCGIVEFAKHEEAALAIKTLHDTELKGRSIFLREDREDYELHPSKRQRPMQQKADDNGDPHVVFVSNLSFDTTEEDLEEHFQSCGEIDVVELFLDPQGRSKGHGLVTFREAQSAESAISKLHNSDLDGRSLTVRADKRPAPKPEGKRTGSGRRADSTQVFVNNLNYRTSWQSLKDHFRQSGNVLNAEVLQDASTADGMIVHPQKALVCSLTCQLAQEGSGRSKGCGIVHFATPEGAQKAILELNETSLDGRQIWVREDRE